MSSNILVGLICAFKINDRPALFPQKLNSALKHNVWSLLRFALSIMVFDHADLHPQASWLTILLLQTQYKAWEHEVMVSMDNFVKRIWSTNQRFGPHMPTFHFIQCCVKFDANSAWTTYLPRWRVMSSYCHNHYAQAYVVLLISKKYIVPQPWQLTERPGIDAGSV